MRRAEIEEQNTLMVRQQREFRMAADLVCDTFAAFQEVKAVAVIGSVAKALWKEVPRFRDFRRAGIEVWHECFDLNLAVWIDHRDRLEAMRRAVSLALRDAPDEGDGLRVANHQVDVFLIEPGSDRYLGRLCHYNRCPRGKRACQVPGCGDVPFNRVVAGFRPYADLLAPHECAMLYERGVGRLRSALDLPGPQEETVESS